MLRYTRISSPEIPHSRSAIFHVDPATPSPFCSSLLPSVLTLLLAVSPLNKKSQRDLFLWNHFSGSIGRLSSPSQTRKRKAPDNFHSLKSVEIGLPSDLVGGRRTLGGSRVLTQFWPDAEIPLFLGSLDTDVCRRETRDGFRATERSFPPRWSRDRLPASSFLCSRRALVDRYLLYRTFARKISRQLCLPAS